MQWLRFGVALLISLGGTLFGSRIAWWVCLSLIGLALLTSGGFVFLNVGAFLLRHPLYQDSPGTILVVAFSAVVTFVPLVFIATLLWLDRVHLMAILTGRKRPAG